MTPGITRLLVVSLLLCACDEDETHAPQTLDASSALDAEVDAFDAAPRRDSTPEDATPQGDAAPDMAEVDAILEDAAPSPDAALDASVDAAPLPPLEFINPLTPPADPLEGHAVEGCAVYQSQRCVDGQTQACAVYDVEASEFTEPTDLFRRALLFERWYELYHQPDGQTAEVGFRVETPPGTPEAEWGAPDRFLTYDGVGDSAIWTGVALNAYALRYAVTGTEADYQRLVEKTRRLLAFFDATGIPGHLSRNHFGQLPPEAPIPHPEHHLRRLDPEALDHKFHFVEAPYEGMPEIYDGVVEMEGASWQTTPMWQGHPSIDQYTGPMVSFPLVWGLLRAGEADVKARIRRHMTCYAKRLQRVEIINLQTNPQIIEAVTALLAGGGAGVHLDEDDIDFTTLEKAVAWVHPNLNDLNREAYERECPESIWRAPDRVVDMAEGAWIAQIIELVQDLQTKESVRPNGIDHIYAPGIRGGNAIQMMNLILQAWRFSGEEMYREFFFRELIEAQRAVEVAYTAAALTMPAWCQKFYGGHISYPVLWVLIAQLPEGDPLREALRGVLHEEFWRISRGPLEDLKFDLMYAHLGPDEAEETRALARERAAANLRAFGGNGGLLDDPRRAYTLPYEEVLEAVGPEGFRCPTPEERAFCEDGIEALGLTLPGTNISRECTDHPLDCALEDGLCAEVRAAEPLPMRYRRFSDFIWQRDPFKVGGPFHVEGYKQSPGLDLIEEFWLARFTGAIDDGEGQVLAWQVTGETCQ